MTHKNFNIPMSYHHACMAMKWRLVQHYLYSRFGIRTNTSQMWFVLTFTDLKLNCCKSEISYSYSLSLCASVHRCTSSLLVLITWANTLVLVPVLTLWAWWIYQCTKINKRYHQNYVWKAVFEWAGGIACFLLDSRKL